MDDIALTASNYTSKWPVRTKANQSCLSHVHLLPPRFSRFSYMSEPDFKGMLRQPSSHPIHGIAKRSYHPNQFWEEAE